MKLKLLTSTILLLSIFTGCSDNGEDKTKKESSTVTATPASKIEIVPNFIKNLI